MDIGGDRERCTVLVVVAGAPEDVAVVADHARDGLEAFARFDGFVAGATHVAADGRRLVQYLQWRDRAAHEACMADPSWAQSESGRRFLDLVEAGRLTVEPQVYDLVAVVEPRA